ncbi:putative sodium/potassium/calcium exchanger [Paenibacillus durus]|uniref:Uncharacterized protein n=1 Tax=Paenibacillus durus TaxID=44251 RepID=A0A089IWM6_PAEDU|nr:hypothetical protein [Paenibacillus durus]AIQ13369.1 hypothetical protein PDUR_16675 [Paenibacillus durus]
MNIGSLIRGLLGDSKPGAAKALELKEGQIVRGVVLNVSESGKEALVQIHGTPVRAELETPLQPGQSLNLQVGPPGDRGMPVLKPAPAGSSASPQTMGEALSALGLSDSKAGREIIQAMQAGGLPLTKETAAKLNLVIDAKPANVPVQEWLEAAVIAEKRGLPVTPGSVRGLQQAVFGPQLHQLLSALEDQLNLWMEQQKGGGEGLAAQPGADTGTSPEAAGGLTGNAANQAAGTAGAANAQNSEAQAGNSEPSGVKASVAGTDSVTAGNGNAAVGSEAAKTEADGKTADRSGAALSSAATQGDPDTVEGMNGKVQPGRGLEADGSETQAPSGTASKGLTGGSESSVHGASMPEGGQAAGEAGTESVQSGRGLSAAETQAQTGEAQASGKATNETQARGGVQNSGAAAGEVKAGGSAPDGLGAGGVRADGLAANETWAGGVQAAASEAQPRAGALLAKLQGVLGELRDTLPQLAALPPSDAAGEPSRADAARGPGPAAAQPQPEATQGGAWVARVLKLLGAEHEQQALRGGGGLTAAAELGPAHPQGAPGAVAGERTGDTVKGVLLQAMGSSDVPAALKEAAGQLVQHLTGQQLLLNTDRTAPFAQVTLFLPLKGPDGEETASVHIQSRRGPKGELDASNCRLWFDLDMKALGQTLVDVQVVDRIVSLKLHNNESWAQELFETSKDEIKSAIETIGYQLSSFKAEPFPAQNTEKPGKGPGIPDDYVPDSYKGVDYRI